MTGRRVGALAGLALLAACTAAPPPPSLITAPAGLPPQWHTPADGGDIGEAFWRGFGDARLDACIERALQHNQDLAAAAARLARAQQQAVIAGADVLPQVDAGLDGGRSRRVFVGFPFGGGAPLSSTSTTVGLSLNLSWELDLWGRLRAGEAAAVAEVQASEADFAAAQLSLIGQTCKSYFAVVAAKEQLALAEATVASTKATAADVRDRFRRGVRPAVDVHLAENNLAAAEAAVEQRRSDLQRAVRQFELLLGSYPEGQAASATALTAQLPDVPAGLPSELLARRPDLAAAERRLAAAGCRVDQARAALYPRLSLTASGGTSSDQLSDLVDQDFRVWSLGANLLQPLFRGGALRADVRRNEAAVAEAVAAYGSTMLRAFGEVETALADQSLLAANERALSSAAEHASAARDLSRERYQLGVADFLAVADGQRQAFAAESQRISARRQRLDNRIDLFLALGGGFRTAPPQLQSQP